MKKLFPYILILLLVGCRTWPPTPTIVASSQTIERDTTEQTRIEVKKIAEPDSATYRALAECDENNRLLINAIDSINGSRIQANLKITEDPVTGGAIIDFTCREDSLMAEIEHRDRIIRELETNTNTVEKIVEKPLTDWQSFCLVLGKIAFALVVLSIIILIAFKICKYLIKR